MESPILEEYRRIAGEAESTLNEKDKPGTVRIQVGSATCENAAGAQEVMEEFRRLITTSGRSDVRLHRTGCTGRCSREPIVQVSIPGKMPVKYQLVDRDIAHQIFAGHVMQGVPVAESILEGSSDRTARYDVMFCSGELCGRIANFDVRAVLEEKLADAGVEADQGNRIKISL